MMLPFLIVTVVLISFEHVVLAGLAFAAAAIILLIRIKMYGGHLDNIITDDDNDTTKRKNKR